MRPGKESFYGSHFNGCAMRIQPKSLRKTGQKIIVYCSASGRDGATSYLGPRKPQSRGIRTADGLAYSRGWNSPADLGGEYEKACAGRT
jgi:hypothetical protein